MNRFASGAKAHYYGKGDVIVYRLNRDGHVPAGRSPVFAANVLLLVYGEAFWPTYTHGDNRGLIATDSMKNFIQRETLEFDGFDFEEYCRFIGARFLAKYPQVEGLQVSASEIPYAPGGPALSEVEGAFAPTGPEKLYARLEMARQGTVEAVSGIAGFKLLRLKGSAFKGFVRDEYTTLPDLHDRPLHMWLDIEWTYTGFDAAFSSGSVSARVRHIVRETFGSFDSGSIQQIIHRIGTRVLDELAPIAEVRLEANNRTWDTIAEAGEVGVYTDAPPPYGCLGLTLTRKAKDR